MSVGIGRMASVVAPGLCIILLGWACSSDPTPATTQGGSGGNGGATSGGGDGGSAGAGTACGEGCNVQCDTILASPSDGVCVGLGGPIECNPITNEGCSTPAGQACDYGPGGFTCYPGPNSQELCQACGPTQNCGAGFTCTTDGVCAKFCCDNNDCGGGGVCQMGALGVGYCTGGGMTSGPGGGGMGNMGGMGQGGIPGGGMGGIPGGGMGGIPGGGMGGVGGVGGIGGGGGN